MKNAGKWLVGTVGLFLILQLVRPGIPSRPAVAEVNAPAAVMQILRKSCYNCHSDERRLAWFDEIEPGYWLVRHDVLTARQHLNFSTLGSKPPAAQKAALYEAVNMIQLGVMPLPSFRTLHPESRVTPDELTTLKAYLAPWSSIASRPAPEQRISPNLISLNAVPPALNGLAFDSGFESWKPISTTDRGDNKTFRLILANDIAVQAVESGRFRPWPDGARFAKIAWQQKLEPDGLVYPGAFIQVEFMQKDHSRFRDTDGWGWGRWKSLDLKPYGSNSHFVNECTGCHMPMRGNDYVYTMPISTNRLTGGVINNRAQLPASLPYQPLGWSAITMYVDPRQHATAVLFGNPTAMKAVDSRGESHSDLRKAQSYPTGSVLALVTWAQRDDPHWFGARIPDRPLSVEFVRVEGVGIANRYRRFAGKAFAEDNPNASASAQRMSFLLLLSPARLP
jgi:hypothetical protein